MVIGSESRCPVLKRTIEFVLSIAVLVGLGVGLYYLDKHTGGNVAGPDGFIRSLFESRPKTSFALSSAPGVLSHEFSLENETANGDLTDVEARLTFHRESGPPVEVKESWPGWRKGEKKKFTVPADSYKRVDLKGTAKLAGKEVTLDTSWAQDQPQSAPPLRGFTPNFDYGLVRYGFEVENGNAEGDLTNVSAVLTFHPESGPPVEVKESWADWRKGEKKRVSVRADRYKRVDLKGTARLAGKDVAIDTHWTWSKPFRPAVSNVTANVQESGSVSFLNGCKDGTLRNVQVTVQLTRNDGVKQSFEVAWPEWSWEETKTISVPPNKYRAYSIKGRASVEGVEVPIDTSGTWSWP